MLLLQKDYKSLGSEDGQQWQLLGSRVQAQWL